MILGSEKDCRGSLFFVALLHVALSKKKRVRVLAVSDGEATKSFARLCKGGAVKGAEPLSHSAEGDSSYRRFFFVAFSLRLRFQRKSGWKFSPRVTARGKTYGSGKRQVATQKASRRGHIPSRGFTFYPFAKTVFSTMASSLQITSVLILGRYSVDMRTFSR